MTLGALGASAFLKYYNTITAITVFILLILCINRNTLYNSITAITEVPSIGIYPLF